MSIGPGAIARFYGLYATAPEVVKKFAEMLLTEPSPTAIPCVEMETQGIIDRNVNVSLLNHMMAVIGYNVSSNSER